MHLHALSASYTKSVLHLLKSEVYALLGILAANANKPYDPYGLMKVWGG